MPSVTVLMPVHNGERFIAHAIDSVLAQTFPDFELLIVDDASTDATPAVIGGYQDPRLRILSNPRQYGLARSLNIGLGDARADLIARLDHDDACRGDRLATQVALMQAQPDLALVGSRARLIDEAGRARGFVERPITPLGIRWMHLLQNPFIHSSTMFRKSVVLSLGGYAEDVPLAEDFDLWGRVLAAYEVCNLEAPLVDYRESRQSIMAAAGNPDGKATLRRSLARLIQRHVSATLRECSNEDAFLLAGLTAGIDTESLAHYLDLVDDMRRQFEHRWPESADSVDYWRAIGRQFDATISRVRESSRGDVLRIAERLRRMPRAMPHLSWTRLGASLLFGPGGRELYRDTWLTGGGSA